MLFVSIIFLINCVLINGDYTTDAKADQIVNLPGAENLDIKFNQFSGYLGIPGTDGSLSKNMHYW